MKKINWKDYMPFVLFGAYIFVLHLKMDFNMADDLFFVDMGKEQGFRLGNWLVERYATWSSRTMIEGLMMVVLAVSVWLWRVLDTFLIVSIFVMISMLFFSKEHLRYKNTCLVLLGLTVTWELFGEAGWAATTLNYIWPLAFGLIALYSVKRCMTNRKLRGYEYVFYSLSALYAANSEQMCVILVLTFGAAICYMLVKKLPLNKYILIQLGICILTLFYIIMCPGNKMRVQEEVALWYPQFSTFGFAKKVELGITATLKTLFLQKNIWIILFLILLCTAIWLKYEDKRIKGIAMLPLLGVLLVDQLCEFRGDRKWPANIIGVEGMSRGEGPELLLNIATCGALVLLCALILICIYLLFGKDISTIVVGGIFLLGLMTKSMMGFSPTVWASGDRTKCFMIFALISGCAWIVEKWELDNRRLVDILCLILIIPAVGGVMSSILNLF